MTFYQYLATLKDEDSPAGDLARDAMRDQYFSTRMSSALVGVELVDYWCCCGVG